MNTDLPVDVSSLVGLVDWLYNGARGRFLRRLFGGGSQRHWWVIEKGWGKTRGPHLPDL